MCLTPRYKGVTCFNKIVTNGFDRPAENISVTMTYSQNGERLVKPLSDDSRVIPDLWTVLQGGLVVDVHLHMLRLSNNPEVMKDQLMGDYADKDALLKHFYDHGTYPAEHPVLETAPKGWKVYHDDTVAAPQDGSVWQTVPVPHARMNASVLVQLAFVIGIFIYSGSAFALYTGVFVIWSVIATSHIVGQVLTGGQSRESLPFEGCTKAIMFRMNGREGLPGKKGDLLDSSKEEKLPAAHVGLKRVEDANGGRWELRPAREDAGDGHDAAAATG
eukprot:scaffold58_cov256-Pinguiococcus_pyrenoidosus.AAC.31